MPNCTALTDFSSVDSQSTSTLTRHLSPVIHGYIRRMIVKNSDRLRISPSTVDSRTVDDKLTTMIARLEQDIYRFHDCPASMQKLILHLERLALSHQVLSRYQNHPDYSQQVQIIEQDIFKLLGLEIVGQSQDHHLMP